MSDTIPIQLTRSGLALSASADELDRLRAEFERQQCLHLPAFLEPGLLRFIQDRLQESVFDEKIHRNVGVELCMKHNTTLSLLFFLTNDPRFFQLVQQLTGCDRIGCFLGRVYRMVPGCGHHDSWHADTVAHRMIAMSVNLSTEVYEGGVFLLRHAESKEMLCEVANRGAGDATIFRIATHLEHRVTGVDGTVPKTAFAGWFKSEPEFLSLLGPESLEPDEREVSLRNSGGIIG